MLGNPLGKASGGWVVLRLLLVRRCGLAQSVWVWAGVLAAAGRCWCDKATPSQAMPLLDNCLGDAALQLLQLAGWKRAEISAPGSTVRHRVALKSLGIIKFYFRSLAPLNSMAKLQLTSQG